MPRLGAYLAVRLEYESCLYEEALDAAVADYVDVRNRLKEQEEEKKQYWERLQDELENNEGGGREDESMVKGDRVWEELKPQGFRTRKV